MCSTCTNLSTSWRSIAHGVPSFVSSSALWLASLGEATLLANYCVRVEPTEDTRLTLAVRE